MGTGRRTLLELAVERLAEAGICHIVVNIHHFADMMKNFIGSRKWPCDIETSDERDLLLDTGGGMKHAAPLFSGRENILVHNVDILSRVDLRDVERRHVEGGNLATLCVSRRQTKRLLAFDERGLLIDRAGSPNLSPSATLLAFSGISVVSPELFALMPEADHPYPVIDEYIRLSHEGHRIGSYIHAPEHWLDVGKPETLEEAKRWKHFSER